MSFLIVLATKNVHNDSIFIEEKKTFNMKIIDSKVLFECPFHSILPRLYTKNKVSDFLCNLQQYKVSLLFRSNKDVYKVNAANVLCKVSSLQGESNPDSIREELQI